MRSLGFLLPIVFILLALAYISWNFYSTEFFYYKWQVTYHPRNISKLKKIYNGFHKSNSSVHSKCILTKLDPFDDFVWQFMDPMLGVNGRKDCNTKFIARTWLENGQLRKMNIDDYCWGRCLYYTFSTTSYGRDGWISTNQNHTFRCDIVESVCSRRNSLKEVDYGYLHTQIYELKGKQLLATKTAPKKYNVLLIVLDSTSSSMAARSLPTTMGFLESEMGAVEFKFLNRVGIHSKVNGAPLFLGKRAEPVPQFDEESPIWKHDMNLNDFIWKAMDIYPQIHKNFSNEGYVTFLGEDWRVPLFSQALTGFKKPIADHTSHPFVTAWELGSKIMKNTLGADNCADKHYRLVDYMEQFLRSYKDVPKFGSYWDVDWAHDDQASLVSADMILHRFFEKNKAFLKDTFVFITGDHGPRYGNFAKTKLGALEADNPMLIIVPPNEIQENKELMNTLKENSEKLQTHWDTRATLFDIMRHQPESNFGDRSPRNISRDGSSMLRKQEGERSCRTLPIPIEYCLCRYPTEDKNPYSNEARYFAQQVIQAVEERIRKENATSLCNKWTIREVIQLTEVTVSESKTLHQITIELKSPQGAQFKSMVSETNGILYVGSIDRLDAYRNRGDCVQHELSPICDCL